MINALRNNILETIQINSRTIRIKSILDLKKRLIILWKNKVISFESLYLTFSKRRPNNFRIARNQNFLQYQTPHHKN